MKKRLIVFVRSVEILDQTKQAFPIKARDLCLDICPRGLRFRLTSGHGLFDFICGAGL
jgi:hypothetical protein